MLQYMVNGKKLVFGTEERWGGRELEVGWGIILSGSTCYHAGIICKIFACVNFFQSVPAIMYLFISTPNYYVSW